MKEVPSMQAKNNDLKFQLVITEQTLPVLLRGGVSDSMCEKPS